MMKGVMIDCSRLLERHTYYRDLIVFMAQWKLNTLLLHFTDDFGCAVALPGLKHLAMPRALTAAEIRSLVRVAAERGIDVIPELETFGHTRYITDHPRYGGLHAGQRTRTVEFGALDPLNPATLTLVERLIRATARLFPSRHMHIGCDEVSVKAYCEKRGLDETVTWTAYVNRVVDLVRANGKIPMLWGDHPVHDRRIAGGLRKDVVLVHWDYTAEACATPIRKLKAAGFRKLVLAPSLACVGTHVLPTRRNLTNTRLLCRYARRHGAQGVINTMWAPWRYYQDAMYYGIAYTGALLRARGPFRLAAFHREFSRRVFGTDQTPALHRFLARAPDMEIPRPLYRKIFNRSGTFNPEEIARLETVNGTGKALMGDAAAYAPAANAHIWNAMVLAVKSVWLCSESVLLGLCRGDPARMADYNRLRGDVRRAAAADWDRTRFSSDPQKRKPMFPNWGDQYLLHLLNRLPVYR
ncbi:MAG: family 20 glycosylhydrolase [Lentisphaerae bacterium]|nr:family 20 glycosylhydrolase [Lentisphaerota bacterium]